MIKDNLLHIIKVPKIKDDGFLFFAQTPDQIPFKIKRVYYITSPKKGLPRGKHAHKKTRQVLFCIRGSVKMVIEDGVKRARTTLTDPAKGILLNRLIWHEMLDMDENTILLVLASQKYDPTDYIRNYSDFLKAAKTMKKR